MFESDGNGGVWISKGVLWTIIIALAAAMITNYAQFVSAQGDIKHLTDQVADMKPKLEQAQQEVAVLKQTTGDLKDQSTRIERKVDKLIDMQMEDRT